MKYKVSFEVELDEIDERSISIGKETLEGILLYTVYRLLDKDEKWDKLKIECIDD